MPVRFHHTDSAAELQLTDLVGDAMDDRGRLRLARCTDEQAHLLKAFQRSRGLGESVRSLARDLGLPCSTTCRPAP